MRFQKQRICREIKKEKEGLKVLKEGLFLYCFFFLLFRFGVEEIGTDKSPCNAKLATIILIFRLGIQKNNLLVNMAASIINI